MIIADSKAFLGKRAEEGAELVSEQYLKDHKVYPLQLKTVRYVAGLIRIASLVVLVLAAAGLLFIARKHRAVLDDRQLDGIHSARN